MKTNKITINSIDYFVFHNNVLGFSDRRGRKPKKAYLNLVHLFVLIFSILNVLFKEAEKNLQFVMIILVLISLIKTKKKYTAH